MKKLVKFGNRMLAAALALCVFVPIMARLDTGAAAPTITLGPIDPYAYEVWVKGGMGFGSHYGDGFGMGDEIFLYADGGKTTFPNGAAVDSKSAQLYLIDYDIKYEGETISGEFDITGAKNILWTSSAAPITAENITNGKYTQTAADKDGPKVSKGKVTAGKVPGVYYVSAFLLEDTVNPSTLKTMKNGKATLVSRTEVTVFFTASTNFLITKADYDMLKTAGTADYEFAYELAQNQGVLRSVAENIKNLSLKPSEKVVIYPMGATKVKYTSAEHENYGYMGEYLVSATKGGEYVTITDALGDINHNGFTITAKDNYSGKPQKVSISVTNLKSGKKTTATVTVQPTAEAMTTQEGKYFNTFTDTGSGVQLTESELRSGGYSRIIRTTPGTTSVSGSFSFSGLKEGYALRVSGARVSGGSFEVSGSEVKYTLSNLSDVSARTLYISVYRLEDEEMRTTELTVANYRINLSVYIAP